MTKHTIYRRYDGKSALLLAVVERDLARLSESTTGCCGGDELGALKLAAWRKFAFSIQPENVAFFSFLSAEALYTPEVRDRFQDWQRQALAPIIDAVERAQAAGRLPSGDPKACAETLLDMIDGSLDGDAMFFSRDLKVTGDTEAVVALRNALDDFEGSALDSVIGSFGLLAAPASLALSGLRAARRDKA